MWSKSPWPILAGVGTEVKSGERRGWRPCLFRLESVAETGRGASIWLKWCMCTHAIWLEPERFCCIAQSCSGFPRGSPIKFSEVSSFINVHRIAFCTQHQQEEDGKEVAAVGWADFIKEWFLQHCRIYKERSGSVASLGTWAESVKCSVLLHICCLAHDSFHMCPSPFRAVCLGGGGRDKKW